MFDGPWGGFLGLIVFAFLCYVALLHEKANTPPPEPYVDWQEEERKWTQEEKKLKARPKFFSLYYQPRQRRIKVVSIDQIQLKTHHVREPT